MKFFTGVLLLLATSRPFFATNAGPGACFEVDDSLQEVDADSSSVSLEQRDMTRCAADVPDREYRGRRLLQMPRGLGYAMTATMVEASSSKIDKKGPKPKIWMYWASGWEDAPLLCQLCAMSWEENNPDFMVMRLDANATKLWLPELSAFGSDNWLTERRSDGNHQVELSKQSDYIRIKLLQKYGGVWADATSMSTGSLSVFMEKHPRSEEFFVFDRRSSDQWPMRDPFAYQGLEFASWFLIYYPYAQQRDLLLEDQRLATVSEALRRRFLRELRGEEETLYFAFHHTVQELEFWKTIWTSMPSVSAQYPHTTEFRLDFFKSPQDEEEDGTKAKDILEDALTLFPGQKLSHKLVSDVQLIELVSLDLLKNTTLGMLMQKAFGGDLDLPARLIRKATDMKDKVLREIEEAAREEQTEVYENWPLLQNRVNGK